VRCNVKRLMWAVVSAVVVASAAAASEPQTILFVGNSFTFGATSAVRLYRADAVHDLNGTGMGGVPALFKIMTAAAGLDYDVSIEAIGGSDLQRHLTEKYHTIARPWDAVVLQSYSTLDRKAPGDSASLVRSIAALSNRLVVENPNVRIYATATWPRADLIYRIPSPWYHAGIDRMAGDIRRAYDEAKSASPWLTAVLPVGQAFGCAMHNGVAVDNPYRGVPFGKIDLWGWDQYHASNYGYYLEALVAFGGITGRDPRSLGAAEISAADLGISPVQAEALQAVAYETLAQQSGAVANGVVRRQGAGCKTGNAVRTLRKP